MNMTVNVDQQDYPEQDLQDLPDNFDARVGFKECRDLIGHVRDQSTCGSCWAFGVTEAFNDRVCIKSNGTHKQLMSAGDMLACCDGAHGCFSSGCDGGSPTDAWSWLYETGIVSGGDYVDKNKMTEADGCWPYNFPKCAHHVNSSEYPAWGKEPYPTPKCVTSCPNPKYSTPFDKDRYYTNNSEPVTLNSISSIKQELLKGGPNIYSGISVADSATFTVYEDFLAYKSGVYKHTSGTELGGHAVKIIGWGNENGEDYWLVVNSWNEEWGDHGLFKIGLTECGIADEVQAGTPKL